MQRSISPIGLMLTSISAVLGSGWLFSAYYTSRLAGPASILSWIISGIFMIIIAFVFAEICAMIPVSGSSTRLPQYTHGTVVSFLFSWMIWLSYVALTSTEVQGIIQYLRFYFPDITSSAGRLTLEGYLTATGIMLAVSAINTYSLRWLIQCNNVLTIIKVLVPIGAALIILFHFFSLHHTLHPAESAFMPKGMHGVFAAMTTGGIVFAYNGFKQAAELAGEAKKPSAFGAICRGRFSGCLRHDFHTHSDVLSNLFDPTQSFAWVGTISTRRKQQSLCLYFNPRSSELVYSRTLCRRHYFALGRRTHVLCQRLSLSLWYE